MSMFGGLFGNAIGSAAFEGLIAQRAIERQRAFQEQMLVEHQRCQYQQTVERITKLERGDDTIRITIAPAYGEGSDG